MSTNEYKRKNYANVNLCFRKGDKAKIQTRAAELGMNLTEFVKAAIDNFDGWGHGEGIPIINTGSPNAAQDAPISTNEQTIQPTAEDAQNRITAADKRLLAAVDALTPESKKALLKFLESLQG